MYISVFVYWTRIGDGSFWAPRSKWYYRHWNIKTKPFRFIRNVIPVKCWFKSQFDNNRVWSLTLFVSKSNIILPKWPHFKRCIIEANTETFQMSLMFYLLHCACVSIQEFMGSLESLPSWRVEVTKRKKKSFTDAKAHT